MLCTYVIGPQTLPLSKPLPYKTYPNQVRCPSCFVISYIVSVWRRQDRKFTTAGCQDKTVSVTVHSNKINSSGVPLVRLQAVNTNMTYHSNNGSFVQLARSSSLLEHGIKVGDFALSNSCVLFFASFSSGSYYFASLLIFWNFLRCDTVWSGRGGTNFFFFRNLLSSFSM